MAANPSRSNSHDIFMVTPRPDSVQEERKETKLVLIKWRDIIQTSDWTTAEEVSCPSVTSVGWLIQDTEEEVKIGNTIGEDDVFYGITAFPKGCVMDIIPLGSRSSQNTSLGHSPD